MDTKLETQTKTTTKFESPTPDGDLPIRVADNQL